jgi:Ca-activated chloride channel family protein
LSGFELYSAFGIWTLDFSRMSFYWPHVLWFLFAPLALLVWRFVRWKAAGTETHPKILRAEAGRRSLQISDLKSQISRRPRPRGWLAAGLVLAILALARPQWGRIEEPVFGQSREILLALDLSRSMNSTDVRPSRLARAKLLIQSLLDRLQGERVGLIVFSGTGFLQSPLSADYEVLRQFLPALDTNFLPEGGTNYHDLLQTALDSFSTDGSADRYLIILSDGEATDDDWQPLVGDLTKKNIRVIGLGVGTAAGSLIPDGKGDFVKDERGAAVLSKLESSTLRELAEKTGGTYTDASSWVDLPTLLQSTIEAGQRGLFHETTRVRLAERFQWALAPALLCLLISFWREFPVRPRSRELKLEPEYREQRADGREHPPSPRSTPSAGSGQAGSGLRRTGKTENISAGASVATLCLLTSAFLLLSGFCPRARAAENDNTDSASLTKLVSHLSAQATPTARDWADLAQSTITYGERLKNEQQSVPAGPVRDALAAVDAGESLDSHAADWSKFRRELAALQRKPPEQKPPPQSKQKQSQQSQKNNSDQNQQDSQPKPSSDGKSQSAKSPQDKTQPSPQDRSSKGDATPESASAGSPQNQPPAGPSAFGDMKEKSPAQAQSRPPAGEPRELQKIGGESEAKAPDAAANDPTLAVPLQKLDQLKQQDSPAAIYELMRGQNKPAPAPNGKDW